MTDTQLLKETLGDKDITQTQIAEILGVTRSDICRKVNGTRQFSAYEVEIISDLLALDVKTRRAIFFPQMLTKYQK